MALVAVLLLVAGLVAIATAVVVLSASQRQAAQLAQRAYAERELLDGALRVALTEICFSKVDGPFWHPRQPRTLPFGERRVEVSVERESGRVDLNTAREIYIAAVLEAGGAKAEDARDASARIRDWIDADDEVSPHGAEREQYRAANFHYAPRNGPFESVDELRQVLGLNTLDDATLDAFTIYSSQSEPAAGEAPPRVRAALAIIAKTAGSEPPAAVLDDTRAASSEPVSYAGAVVRLRACLEPERDVCRTTVVRITGNARQPMLVLAWR
ncbi:MAG TPA: hypothetical protein VMF52_06495 [Steroidobacteraceae bacterium]|nr:hypothetical protein [Steroidobacteraceae bacterium]